MKFFLLEFLNPMSCKNRNGGHVGKHIFKDFFSFSKFGLNALLNTLKQLLIDFSDLLR